MPGTRLGVDVGSVRIGLARCDAEQILALPVETVPAGVGAATRVAQVAAELGVTVAYIGLPVSLAQRSTASTMAAVAFATELVAAAPSLDVRLVDERLSTATATAHLRAAGRSSKRSKAVIDQAAAMVILEHALEMERSSGRLAGVTVGEYR